MLCQHKLVSVHLLKKVTVYCVKNNLNLRMSRLDATVYICPTFLYIMIVHAYIAQKPDIFTQRCICSNCARLGYCAEIQIIVGTVYSAEIQIIVGTVYCDQGPTSICSFTLSLSLSLLDNSHFQLEHKLNIFRQKIVTFCSSNFQS